MEWSCSLQNEEKTLRAMIISDEVTETEPLSTYESTGHGLVYPSGIPFGMNDTEKSVKFGIAGAQQSPLLKSGKIHNREIHI
jgi:hypothetical protein